MKDNLYELVVDINPIYNGEKQAIDFSYEFFPQIDKEDIIFEEKTRVLGRVFEKTSGSSHDNSYIELQISLHSKYKTSCARCSKEINEALSVASSFAVVPELNNEENDDYIISEEGKIDIGSLAETLIVLNLPFRSLCSPSCKGLCYGCGSDLNHEDCKCENNDIDPRLAVLKKLLDKD